MFVRWLSNSHHGYHDQSKSITLLKRVPKRALLTLFEIAMIAVGPWAFAQEGSVSDFARRCSEKQGNQEVTLLFLSPGYSGGPATLHACLRDPFASINPVSELNYRPSQSKRLSWETGEGKSYLIPALEIPGFIVVLNAFDRIAYRNQEENGKKVYRSTPSTFWHNLTHGPWKYDTDAFDINQFGHPYQGSLYHGFARSAGLSYWESAGYTFLGSFLWETAGETTHPSVNDQVASGIAGSFFGEVLFRMASLLLESGGATPGFWRELGAAALSPPTGLNRLVFGDRFKAVFPSHDPAVFQWVRLAGGFVVSDHTESNVTHRNQESLTYNISYGLPGKPGYTYKRPFDYFQFEAGIISRSHVIENITTRGLLLGAKYELGESYRGIWGVYGSFDYISPRFFRVSTTAASLGTTFQWWLGPRIALQSTALGGVGLGAAGKAPSELNRDFHYGIAGRTLLALRLIFSDLAMFDLTGRGYYVSSLGGSQPKGSEAIVHFEPGLFFRIYGHHSLGIQYTTLFRNARYKSLSHVHQSQGTLSLVYSLLSDTRFGAVEWRNGREQTR